METIHCHPNMPSQSENKQVIGMAYVPMQIWQDLMPMDQGFYKGTIFQELNKPFQPKRR